MSVMAELKRSDFSKICRTCLLQKDNMEPIYKSDIPKMLLSFTNIKVENDVDEMPKLICQECITQITNLCDFLATCEKNTSKLLTLLTEVAIENNIKYKTHAKEKNIEKETPTEKKNIKNETSAEESTLLKDIYGASSVYQCEYCARTYIEKKYLNRHRKTHDRGYNCSCKNVPPIEIWEDNFDDNEMDNKRKIIYKCPKCDKIYSEKKYVNRHLKSHKCFCSESDNFEVSVIDEIKCVCKTIPPIEIWEDDDVVDNELEKRKVIYQCPMCDKSYSEKRYVNRHLKSHKCVCSETRNCSVIEIDEIKLIQNKNSVLDPALIVQNGMEVFQCSACKKVYRERKFYNRHFRTNHLNISNRYPCTKCDRVFKSTSSLKRHVKTIHENQKQVCTICGKLVIHLRLHIREQHNSERPYKCSLCNKRFTVPSKRKQHVREKHMGQRAYKLCSLCGKKCHSFCALDIHMRSHTGEKPFDCSDCGKQFRNKHHLRDHKLIHTGQRPHICTFCKKGFKTAYALKGHIRIHTGECPYVCTLCQRAFVQKSSLNSHMRTHCTNN